MDRGQRLAIASMEEGAIEKWENSADIGNAD